MKLRLLPLVFGILAVAPVDAAAIANQTFLFSGTCTDCEGNGTATLVLTSDYVLGTQIQVSDLVSFTYNGTNLFSAFTIVPNDFPNIFGAIPSTLPGPADFSISVGSFSLTGGLVIVPAVTPGSAPYFNSSTDGTWSVGDNNVINDFGTSGSFSVASSVPEPSSVVLIGAGLVALGWRHRQRWAK